MSAFLIAAKCIVAFVAVYGYGGLLFDAVLPATARQHLWNPVWAPHAKMHNGQTMLLGILNGTLSLIILFSFPQTTLRLFFVAAALAAFYWVALLLAALFPGTAWCDPEFLEETPPAPRSTSTATRLMRAACPARRRKRAGIGIRLRAPPVERAAW